MYTIQLCCLPGRLREQARSHSWIAGWQVEKCRLSGRYRRQASSHIWIVGCQVESPLPHSSIVYTCWIR